MILWTQDARVTVRHGTDTQGMQRGQREYLHMVYVTHTEAPRNEGKQRRVMKMVVI